MKKLNKKGFTLVEMLVVIAIIAVLVAIIIPTVSSSTSKAKAATDAANLRSAQATATIQVLQGTLSNGDHTDASAFGVPATSKLDGGAFKCTVTSDAGTDSDTGATIKVYYGEHDVDYYAAKAGGEAAPTTSTSPEVK